MVYLCYPLPSEIPLQSVTIDVMFHFKKFCTLHHTGSTFSFDSIAYTSMTHLPGKILREKRTEKNNYILYIYK